jgi:hypothetical protein
MNLSLLDIKIIQLINQYSVNGSLVSALSNADYLLKTRNLIDACNKEIASKKKIPATKHISQNPIPNQIQGFQGQFMYQHLNKDITFTAVGSKAYYFECDKQATVTIEVNGVTQATLNLTDTEFTPHSGFITSQASDSVVIRFSGLYPYNIQNIALYAYAFATVEDIPQYRAYNIYPLPLDYMEMQNVKIEQYPFSYVSLNDYFIQHPNILINSFISGNISINYFKYPTSITTETAETTELENTPDAQELIPYYVAGHVYLEDNITIGTMLLNEYENKLSKLLTPPTSNQTTIINSWGW